MDETMYPDDHDDPSDRIKNIGGVLYWPLIPRHLRVRATTAEVNAGKVVLPAPPPRSVGGLPNSAYRYRVLDCSMIAIGGNAGGSTSVDLLGVQSGSAVKLVAAAVAGLTRSAVLQMGASNAAILADGASLAVCDPGAPITLSKTGSDLTTATAIDLLLTYVVE